MKLNSPNKTLAQVQDVQKALQKLNLADDVVPIFPEHVSTDKVYLGRNHSLTFQVQNFPIVPSFALTVHKIQGQTLQKAIIGSFKNNKTSFASFSAMYVALSRARKLEGLLLLEPFDKQAQSKCATPTHLANELDRLRSLETKFKQ